MQLPELHNPLSLILPVWKSKSGNFSLTHNHQCLNPASWQLHILKIWAWILNYRFVCRGLLNRSVDHIWSAKCVALDTGWSCLVVPIMPRTEKTKFADMWCLQEGVHQISLCATNQWRMRMYASLDINRLMYLDSFFSIVKQYFLNMFLNSTYKKTNKPLMGQGISRSALTECEKVLDLPEARCSLLKVCILFWISDPKLFFQHVL